MTPEAAPRTAAASVARSMRQQIVMARAQPHGDISSRWLSTLGDWATILEAEAAAGTALDVPALILTLYDEVDRLHKANAVFEDGDPAISARIAGVKWSIGRIKEAARLAGEGSKPDGGSLPVTPPGSDV